MLSFAKGRLIVGLLGLSFLASGCSLGNSSAAPANKTLIIDTSFTSTTADPTFPGTGGQTDFQVSLQMYETLVQANPGHTPLLAQSYVASPDGLSVTFTLRHDVHFSDG